MKIKLEVSAESLNDISQKLIDMGFELSDDADYILVERNRYSSYISCKNQDISYHIPTDEVLYIESMGHDITLHTKDKIYKCSEPLAQLEKFLNPNEFVRISKSGIIAVNKVKGIRVALSQKFIVTLCNGDKVDVTRSYYYIFKNHFGI